MAHTTATSITYEGPRTRPAIPGSWDSCGRRFSPSSSASFEKQTGQKAFYYGNFNRDRTQWTTYPAEGRYGTTYVGLRNRLSILSEAYSHAPFKTRVLATRDFVLECLRTAVSHKAEIVRLLAQSRPAAGRSREAAESSPTVSVPIRLACESSRETRDLARFCRARGERPPASRQILPRTTRCKLVNEFEGTESVARPFAYLVPPTCSEAIANLQRHGLDLQELREDIELDLEVYKVDSDREIAAAVRGA